MFFRCPLPGRHAREVVHRGVIELCSTNFAHGSAVSALAILFTLARCRSLLDITSPYFYRATLCINVAYAVARCLSVRLSRSCILTKRVNISSIFSPSDSHIILAFFRTKHYSNGDPHNGGVECRWGGQKSRFSANIYLHHAFSTVRLPSVKHLA